jgi:hypothetical protein
LSSNAGHGVPLTAIALNILSSWQSKLIAATFIPKELSVLDKTISSQVLSITCLPPDTPIEKVCTPPDKAIAQLLDVFIPGAELVYGADFMFEVEFVVDVVDDEDPLS